MSWFRPTLSSLISRNQADMDAKLVDSSPLLRRSNLNVIARMVAGLAHGLYGAIAYLAKQIIYDTSEGDFLKRWASIWLPTPVIPAAYAVGPVLITGTNGTLVEAGTIFIRGDGVEYETDVDATIVAGQAIVAVTAIEAGQAGNAAVGVALNIASPIAGINGTATVHTGGLTSGADEETEASTRARLISRIQNPPHGGARHDYETWALEVPGVTRAWCSPGEMGAGTVTTRFVRDNDDDLIPDPPEVEVVQTYIDERRPVTAKGSYVVAPVPELLNFDIALNPDTAEIRAAVEAELRDLLLREAEPERGNGEGTILLSHIKESISLAAGEKDHVLHQPTANVTHTLGKMAKFGAITWL